MMIRFIDVSKAIIPSNDDPVHWHEQSHYSKQWWSGSLTWAKPLLQAMMIRFIDVSKAITPSNDDPVHWGDRFLSLVQAGCTLLGVTPLTWRMLTYLFKSITLSYKKMHLHVSTPKCRPFCKWFNETLVVTDPMFVIFIPSNNKNIAFGLMEMGLKCVTIDLVRSGPRLRLLINPTMH